MLPSFMISLGILVIGAALVWLVTRVILGYAQTRSLIDVPNQRSSHERPTPRGGGLGMVIFFLGAIAILYALDRVALDDFMALFVGTILVAGIGFWDDHDPVSPGLRLLVHATAASLSLLWIGGFPAVSIAGLEFDFGLFGYTIGILYLVWMLNLFNFMDGSDAIAGAEALFVSLCAAWFCSTHALMAEKEVYVWILAVLASGCLGFLLWNWPPAAIFLGDVGSGFLGFMLGLLALMTSQEGLMNIWTWFILTAVFFVDATVTLLRRILRGERWTQAHRSHAYQHAVRRFRSHRTVVLAVTGINLLWNLPLAFFSELWPAWGFFLFCVAITPLIVLAYQFEAGLS